MHMAAVSQEPSSICKDVAHGFEVLEKRTNRKVERPRRRVEWPKRRQTREIAGCGFYSCWVMSCLDRALRGGSRTLIGRVEVTTTKMTCR